MNSQEVILQIITLQQVSRRVSIRWISETILYEVTYSDVFYRRMPRRELNYSRSSMSAFPRQISPSPCCTHTQTYKDIGREGEGERRMKSSHQHKQSNR